MPSSKKAKGVMALSENVDRVVYNDRPLVVMPAVVGGHPSPTNLREIPDKSCRE
jgi:hypothetical protein